MAGYRATLYRLCTEQITLGSAYSETAAAALCSRGFTLIRPLVEKIYQNIIQ